MDEATTNRAMAQQSFDVVLYEDIYQDAVEQLRSALDQARGIHTRDGAEVAAGIDKAIGLLCNALFERRQTRIPGLTGPWIPPEDDGLTIELAPAELYPEEALR